MTNIRRPLSQLELHRGSLVRLLQTVWNPVPISKPLIDQNLPDLTAMQRIAEVLRYKFMQLEYAISSNGGLRAWIKLNLLVGLILGIPALLIFPIITLILSSFTTWTAYLFSMAINLLFFFLCIAAIIAVVMITHFSFKAYIKFQREQREKELREQREQHK